MAKHDVIYNGKPEAFCMLLAARIQKELKISINDKFYKVFRVTFSEAPKRRVANGFYVFQSRTTLAMYSGKPNAF